MSRPGRRGGGSAKTPIPSSSREVTDDPTGLVLVVFAAVVAVAVVAGGSGPLDWLGDTSPVVVGAILVGLLVPILLIGSRASQAGVRRREAAQGLVDLEGHDSLTGLRSRKFLAGGFEEMLRRARRSGGRIGVFFVDLEGLREINDAHGPDVGDHVLATVAGRLEEASAADDVVVRYGGDEFVLLCPDVGNATAAERVARRIVRAVDGPIDHEDEELRVTASIGIAITEERCNLPQEVIRDADVAMYQAKYGGGGGHYALFDRSVSDAMTPSIAERRLRQALENGEFQLYYQPMVSLWTKRLVGVEALLRWKDPERGTVSPGEFLPLLEETGLIVPVGRWVLEEVCRQSKAWETAHPDRPPLNLKVNFSARQLAQADAVDQVRSVLESSGAKPERLSLEVPEGALMYDLASAMDTLRQIKELGVSIALDDFGTGSGSLTCLRALDIDLLTIPKTYVDGLLGSHQDAVIIEHLIGLAKALSIVTVAEGVESEEQMERLRELTCDLAQGYWFSHPQPPDVISQLLEADAGSQEWRPPDRDVDDEPAEEPHAAPTVELHRFSEAT